MGKTPPALEPTDVPVEVIEWRDGTLLDTLFKPSAKK
jgi:citrate lyase alpha subunit